jgi:predicted DNA-binding protein with PD1-like motif
VERVDPNALFGLRVIKRVHSRALHHSLPMKKNICLFILFITAVALPAAELKNEVTNATTLAMDSKPNSAEVPDVYAIDGKFERVVILRFKYQADLLAGLEQMVKQHNIKNAVILSAIGSVRGYHYHVVSNSTFPSKNLFIKDPDSPADISSMNGYVMNGRLHPHITFSNDKNSFGGHLEPGTSVFTFAIVTLGVLPDGADLSRLDDKTYR